MAPKLASILLVAALLAATPPALAQGAVVAPAPEAAFDSLGLAAAAAADSIAPAAAPAPAPADHVAEVRASFTPENRAYSSMRAFLAFLEPFYAVVVAVVVLFSGLAARMRDVAHAMGRGRYVRMLVFLILYGAVGFVLAFPLEWYRGFALEHQFGLSTQTFGGWLSDQLKAEVMTVALFGATGLLALAYLAIEKSPRGWWWRIAAGTLPVIVVLALLQPIVFAPMFNKFERLSDRGLERRIVALAERAGIPGRNVYEVDRSRQTRKLNAYVSGFGPSQRIVLWDTTLREASEDEILFIMGHEMGHYALHHIWKGIALTVLLAFALLFLARLVMGWALARFGAWWGITDMHDVATVPLLAATLSVLLFLIQPASNTFSRAIEHEADVFALEVTRANDAGARAFIKLAAHNRSNPEPAGVVKFFLYTHPPLVERIGFALEYRPWERGAPNRVFEGEPMPITP